MQHEAEQLELELEELDGADKFDGEAKLRDKRRDGNQCPIDLQNGVYPSHLTRSRAEVLSLLKMKLLEYGTVVRPLWHCFAAELCVRRVSPQM